MSREIMADGSENQEIEVVINGPKRDDPETPRPFEKDHVPGMEHLREDDPNRVPPSSVKVPLSIPGGAIVSPSGAYRTSEYDPAREDYEIRTEGHVAVAIDPKTGKEVARVPEVSGRAEFMVVYGPFNIEMTPGDIRSTAESLFNQQEVELLSLVPDSKVESILVKQEADIRTKFFTPWGNLKAAKDGLRTHTLRALRNERDPATNQPLSAEQVRQKEQEFTKQFLAEDKEMENIYKEFVVRWFLRTIEIAVTANSPGKLQEVVSAPWFRDAFFWMWELERLKENGKNAFEEGAKWIEATEGACFRAATRGARKPTEAEIVNSIATELRKSRSGRQAFTGDRAQFGATLIYRFYLGTAEVTRFVGPAEPVKRDNKGGQGEDDKRGAKRDFNQKLEEAISTARNESLLDIGKGVLGQKRENKVERFLKPSDSGEVQFQPVEQRIRLEVFKSGPIDLKNLEYWRKWIEQWQKPEYNFQGVFASQLSGINPFLWTKTIFTPEYLATRSESAINARGLIRVFDTHVRPLSTFYGYKNPVEMYQKRSRSDSAFFFWAGLVSGAADFVDKQAMPFLTNPIAYTNEIMDDPKGKMPQVIKPFIDMASGFEYLLPYSSAESSRMRAYVFEELLTWIRTDEAQRVAKMKNERWGTNQRWGRQQFYWAIYYVSGLIGEARAERLYKKFGASSADDWTSKIMIEVDKGVTGGLGRKVWNFIKGAGGI